MNFWSHRGEESITTYYISICDTSKQSNGAYVILILMSPTADLSPGKHLCLQVVDAMMRTNRIQLDGRNNPRPIVCCATRNLSVGVRCLVPGRCFWAFHARNMRLVIVDKRKRSFLRCFSGLKTPV